MNWEKLLEWSATLVIIVGAVFAALDIYPWSAILLNGGAFLWLILAIMWRRASLIIINAALLIIYTVGLIVKLS